MIRNGQNACKCGNLKHMKFLCNDIRPSNIIPPYLFFLLFDVLDETSGAHPAATSTQVVAPLHWSPASHCRFHAVLKAWNQKNMAAIQRGTRETQKEVTSKPGSRQKLNHSLKKWVGNSDQSKLIVSCLLYYAEFRAKGCMFVGNGR